MSGNAEIVCSRCGTPFPKEKGGAAVTCVVCGQLRPDLDLTLDDDDDDDLAAALGASAGGGASRGIASATGGGGEAMPPEAEPPSHVLRVASPPSSTIDSSPAPRGGTFRVDQPYMAMSETRMPPVQGAGAQEPSDRLMERIGAVLLVVCPLAAGMAGALDMLARTEDFSNGTWYAVGAVFVIMLAAALFLGLAVTGLLFLFRIRFTLVIRVAFIAAAAVACLYGLRLLPSQLSKADAIAWSITGPVARASGVARDVRKDDPYLCFQDNWDGKGAPAVDFKVPIMTTGDVYARYYVRLEEMRQSIHIIRQLLDNIPRGPVNISPETKDVLPPKDQVYGSIEGLIHQFEMIMTNRGFPTPVGEVYNCIESANGELGYYIVSDGSFIAHRARTRPPIFINYQAFPKMIEGHTVSDVVAVLGSLNIIAAELDR